MIYIPGNPSKEDIDAYDLERRWKTFFDILINIGGERVRKKQSMSNKTKVG